MLRPLLLLSLDEFYRVRGTVHHRWSSAWLFVFSSYAIVKEFSTLLKSKKLKDQYEFSLTTVYLFLF